jgi:hypothetical protein
MAMGSSSDTRSLRHHDDVLVMVSLRNVLALAWYDAPRPGHLLEVLRVVQDIHKVTGHTPHLLDVVVRGTPRFPEQVREEGGRLVRETAPLGGVTAHVIEVEGLAGTATRVFLSTMLLLGRGKSSSMRVFSEPKEACAWLAPSISRPDRPSWTPAELEQLYRDLKAISPKPPRF